MPSFAHRAGIAFFDTSISPLSYGVPGTLISPGHAYFPGTLISCRARLFASYGVPGTIISNFIYRVPGTLIFFNRVPGTLILTGCRARLFYQICRQLHADPRCAGT